MRKRRHPKADRLNVRHYLEDLVETFDCMTEMYKDGDQRLPPAVRSTLIEFKVYARAILRKHETKQTRKDIYVPAP